MTQTQFHHLKTKIIAYDGWPLVYQPFTPAALHLLALLENAPADETSLVLLPGPPGHALPDGAHLILSPAADTSTARLAWEQVRLPRLAAAHDTECLVLATLTPPLVSRTPVVCYPADWGSTPHKARPLSERLRQSLAAGGTRALERVAWPVDLPVPHIDARLERLPPLVHPLFYENSRATTGSAPANPYVLYTGPLSSHNLRLLLAGWSWVSPAVGNDTLLILPGLSPAHQVEVEEQLAGSEYADTVRAWPLAGLEELAGLYRQAAVVVHLGPAHPWGDPLTAALACGQALVALEEPLTAARVGPAAYLVPPDDARTLGAALLTLLVEESLAGQLRAAARQRAVGWASVGPAG